MKHPIKRIKPRNTSNGSFPNDLFAKIHSLENQFEMLYKMFDRIGDEVMLIRANGRIAYVNEATVKGLGYSRDYLLNRSITQFQKNKLSLKQWQKDFLDVLRRTKKPIRFSVERLTKKRELQIIEIMAVCISFQQEDYVLSVARDITQPLALQKELKESEERYREVCEGAADCILTCDLQGRITYVNKAGGKLIKKAVDQIVGTHFRIYVEKKSLLKAFEIFYAAQKGISPIHEEVELVDSEGRQIPVDVHVTTLYKGGKIFQLHALVRDISKRKEFEYVQRQSERIQALTHFISGTVHQIKYPLSAVHEILQGLLKNYRERDFEYIGYNDFKNIMGTIQNVSDKVDHCHEITERLLTISEKKLGLKKETCRINQIVQEAVKLIDERYLPANVRIKLNLSAHDPAVVISHVEFSQIMVNILTNAVQAMPAGGVITVKTSRDLTQHKAVIVVKDEGIGIKKEHLSRIFEPFFTTKQLGVEKSSGLGLSIVYAVVHAHQGRVDVRSDQREGTLVRVEFPLVRK